MDTFIIKELIGVLSREAEVYEGILKLAQNKTDIIVGGKVSNLENITRLEQSLIFKIRDIEDEREELLGKLSKQLNVEPSEITVSELIKHLEKGQAVELERARQRIVSILNKLRNANELNAKLIRNSLEYIDFSINLISAVDSGNNNYGNSGQVKSTKKRNFFDVKL